MTNLRDQYKKALELETRKALNDILQIEALEREFDKEIEDVYFGNDAEPRLYNGQ